MLHAAIGEMDALATRLEELLRQQHVAEYEAAAEVPFSGWMQGDSLAPRFPSTLEACDTMLAAADLGVGYTDLLVRNHIKFIQLSTQVLENTIFKDLRGFWGLG